MIREYKYSSFDQDMVSNAGQNYELPQDYRYIRDKWWEKLLAPLLYALFALFARFYIHIVLHGRFVGKEKFLEVPRNKGFFIFGNHTQPVGDPFLAIAVGLGPRTRRRNRAVGSPANFSIPVLGKLFPMVGGIPTASSREGLMKMDHAISYYCSKAQPVVIPGSTRVAILHRHTAFCRGIVPLPGKGESALIHDDSHLPEQGRGKKATGYDFHRRPFLSRHFPASENT